MIISSVWPLREELGVATLGHRKHIQGKLNALLHGKPAFLAATTPTPGAAMAALVPVRLGV